MYKIAILGCENSHANTFLDFIISQKVVSDVEVVGVYSDDMEAAEKLHEKYGVNVAASYDEFVGKIDGLIVTARHGDNHYKYAKPYISSGIPMFIDKPITISEEEARELVAELKHHNVRACGGSMCMFASYVQELKQTVKEQELGMVTGGFLRAPVSVENEYGGFFFYSQHLVQVMCEIFGYNPKSVQVFKNGGTYTCVFRYEAYDITAVYAVENNRYYAGISCEQGVKGSMYTLEGCAKQEFDMFYRILSGGEQEQSYEEFIAPVFILNAVYRSMQSGKEEKITL